MLSLLLFLELALVFKSMVLKGRREIIECILIILLTASAIYANQERIVGLFNKAISSEECDLQCDSECKECYTCICEEEEEDCTCEEEEEKEQERRKRGEIEI